MEWLWSVITAIGGWWFGYWQSTQDRKKGVEEGAQAAFNIEMGLVGFLLESDRQRLKEVFKDVDLTDPSQVRTVAQAAGEAYAEIIAEIIRRDRKEGVEEGAQAAFNIEMGLVGFLLESDRQRLKEVFKNVDLTDPSQVRAVAQVAGAIYAEIIRRDAFEDARRGNFSEHDLKSWQRAFQQEMPPVGYQQGYLQAIKDVIAGAKEYAPKYFEEAIAKALIAKIEQSQHKFAELPAAFYLDSYDPNGKLLGAELLVEVVCRTFDRAEKERGAIPVTATPLK